MPDRPRIAIFGPDPLLTVAIEQRPGGGDEVHMHVGGQGVWVARIVAELGGEPVLCAFIGGETGEVSEGLLADMRPRLVPSGQQTGAYVVDRREERTVLAHSLAGPRTRHEIDDLVSVTTAAAAGSDALVLCNPYPAEGVPARIYAQLVADARGTGTPVYVDLSTPRLDSALEGRPDLVKINDWELAEFVRGPVAGPDLRRAAEAMRERGAPVVVITRGERPAVAFGPEGAIEIVPPRFGRGHREGCGDSMMGALAVALARGTELPEALRIGAAAGAANFLRQGLAGASAGVIDELVGQVEVRPYEDEAPDAA